MKKRYKGPTPQNKTPRPNRRYHSIMYNNKGYYTHNTGQINTIS